MKYYKRAWAEHRGDAYSSWGTSIYYFEVDEEHFPVRQMELYENGQVLQYDGDHTNDGYGMLSDQPLKAAEFEVFEIDASEFEEAWNTRKALNR